jgi:predicted nuclease of predicted toxin-antitoxin system
VNFLLDHDVPIEVARLLKREGHSVHRLIDVLPITTLDPEVFAHAKINGFVTVTCNRKDFLPLAESGPQPGLIVLIRRKTRQSECAHLLELLRRAGESGISGNINFA